MKKILHIAVLIIVLLPTQGVVLFQHFCGGQLVNFEFFEKQSHSCCHEQDEPCGSCEDEEALWETDEYHNPKIPTHQPHPALVASLNLVEDYDFPQFEIKLNILTHYQYPPCWSGRHRFILHQSFLL